MSEYSSTKQHYLEHIRWDAYLGQSFVEGMTYEQFIEDTKTQYACERAIQNVSEATRDLEEHMKELDADFKLEQIDPDIDWTKAKGIGNVMRHDYETVQPQIVWGVVQDHLPVMQEISHRELEKISAHYADEPELTQRP